MRHPDQADLDRPETWVRHRPALCADCSAGCCSLPVEVKLDDLIRLGLADPFEAGEPLRQVARRLQKAGVVEHFNHRTSVFTLTRLADGACLYLDRASRRCTVYAARPDTCRNHPRVGPRPGFCAYRPRGR